MWELKHLFDPTMTINPGVVLSRDPELHIKNLKQSPAASPIVDRWAEVTLDVECYPLWGLFAHQ